MNIADRLHQVIIQKGLTAYQVSQDTGVSDSAISLILNNKTIMPHKRTIRAIALYLNISEVWLSTGKGERDLPSVEEDLLSDPMRVVLIQKSIIQDLMLEISRLTEELKKSSKQAS